MNRLLAILAQEEAKKNYHGDTDAAIGNLQPLLALFEDDPEVTLEGLNSDWSGAFAFLCVQQAGFGLPVRYPDPRVGASFAYVEAWERYARLPKIGLWRHAAETLEVGDLVVFEMPEGKAPCMGIVLQVNEDGVEYAVGNYRNHSAVIERGHDFPIRGSIRLTAAQH